MRKLSLLLTIGAAIVVIMLVAVLSYGPTVVQSANSVTDIPNPDAYTCSQPGFITFEDKPDGFNLSSGAIAGVQFTTTGGFSWLVADFDTGLYNGKYPAGAFTSQGTHLAWLGPLQGTGRIDFVNGPASYFSLLVSGISPVSLAAYDASDNLLETAGPSADNVNTGHMDELKVVRGVADIAYVVVHDTGDLFIVDSMCTNAPGVPGTGPLESVTATIGSGGGPLSTGCCDSVEVDLNVPPGALPGDVEITIDVYNAWEVPAPTGDGVFLSRAFLFEPDGLQFSTPATVVISYDESEVAGIDEATMDVLVYDSQADDWSIDNVIARDTTANTLTIAITHFSGRVSTERDADGDGCPNEYEERDDEMIGGLRDMLNENDYYDVAISGGAPGQDQYIDLFNDIASVIDHYAPSGEVPPYDENYDRGPSAGPFEWNMTGPDGVIDLFNDIVGVIAQAGHDCR